MVAQLKWTAPLDHSIPKSVLKKRDLLAVPNTCAASLEPTAGDW